MSLVCSTCHQLFCTRHSYPSNDDDDDDYYDDRDFYGCDDCDDDEYTDDTDSKLSIEEEEDNIMRSRMNKVIPDLPNSPEKLYIEKKRQIDNGSIKKTDDNK
jgi:hypothetical protein